LRARKPARGLAIFTCNCKQLAHCSHASRELAQRAPWIARTRAGKRRHEATLAHAIRVGAGACTGQTTKGLPTELRAHLENKALRRSLPRKKNSSNVLTGAICCVSFAARLNRAVAQIENLPGDSTMAKKNAAPTKSEILAAVSKDTGLTKKQVSGVLESLGGSIKKALRSGGLFTLPGLCKMKVVKKPATKAREGINPFTGEKMTFKAKAASKKVRIMALKNLKEMVN
jgi:nucleoid DNA-binding protein